MKIVKEALRYLGYRNNAPEPEVYEIVNQCIKELRENSMPKFVYETYNLEISGQTVKTDIFTLESKSLSKNLRGCEKIAVFGATIGHEADKLIRKYSVTSMPKSIIMDAVATALIEEYCDEICGKIKEDLGDRYLRPRFSPGYGDFPISYQKNIIDGLMSAKKIGLMLTEGLMLTPSKSVTAIIGISTEDNHCVIEGCEACKKLDCPFRR